MKYINQIVFLLSLFIPCLSHAMVPPLHVAVCNDNLEQARTLLDAGEDVNVLYKGLTPLCKAVSNKGEAIVGLLIKRGANVNAADESGDRWTPLHKAALHGHETIARLLLEAGADLDAETRHGWKPLKIAEQCGKTAVATLLRDWPLKNQREEKKQEERIENSLLTGFLPEEPDEEEVKRKVEGLCNKENSETHRPTNESWFSQFNNTWLQRGAVTTAIAGLGVLGYQLLKRK